MLYKAAGCLHRCGDFRAAADYAERAAAEAPKGVEIWILLAYIHLATGGAGDARRALAEAQRLSPDDVRVLNLTTKVLT